MVKVFVVLGLALLAGGSYAIVDGWPYLVLERGFTEVILGALATTAGLILLALAAVLAEVRRLKAMVTGAMAVMSLGTDRRDEPAPGPAPARGEALPPPQAPGFGAGSVAAGAGVIALGGALAGLAQERAHPDADENTSKAGDPATVPAASAAQGEAAEEAGPSLAEPVQAGAAADDEDWLSPPDPAPHRAAAPELATEEPDSTAEAGADIEAEPDFFEAALLPTPPGELAARAASEMAASHPAPDAVLDEEPEPEAEPQPELALEPEPEASFAEATAEADRIWWPRLDRAGEEGGAAKPFVASDDFSALREQLTDALAKPAVALEVEPPRRALDPVGDWMAPRSWPPLTQPRSDDALGALDEAASGAGAASAHAEAAATPPPVEDWAQELAPVLPDEAKAAAPLESAESEVVPPTAQEPAPEPPAALPEMQGEERPAASDEGVIGAYQVGETHFTIFADGSIQARTPDGDYVFASMEELKAYLASEKSRLELGSG